MRRKELPFPCLIVDLLFDLLFGIRVTLGTLLTLGTLKTLLTLLTLFRTNNSKNPLIK
jgi:hypothetical protein